MMNGKKSVPDFMLAAFDSTTSLLHAAEKMRDNGFKKWDCYTPFPIHGMDAAMGLKPYCSPMVLATA